MTDDQDFFFDEEETAVEAPAEKPAKSPAKSTAPTVAAATTSVATAVQTVTVTVAALIGVVALLTGVIVGILLPVGNSGSVPAPTTTGASATAPELSPEALESGTLPEGHPDITGMGGETGEATGTMGGGEATTTAP